MKADSDNRLNTEAGTAQDRPRIDRVLKINGRKKMRRWQRYLLFLAIVAVLVLGGGYMVQSVTKAAPIAYRTVEASMGSITSTVSATGTAEPRTSVNVGAEISGRISAVHVDFNDMVRKGQLLAELDREQLEAAVKEAGANLVSAQAQLQQAEAQLNQAKLSEEKIKSLYAQKISSREDFENAESSRMIAEASRASAAARVAVAQASVDSARTNLGKTRIVSPIDGMVLSRSAEVGQAVASSMSISTLFIIAADLRSMQLLADIDEADVSSLKVGQHATFTVDAFPNRTFDAIVEQVRNQPTEEENVVTYKAVLSVDNSENLLRPGMTATITITTNVHDNVLVVPNAALRFEPAAAETHTPKHEGKSLWVLVNGRPRPVPVTLGDSDGSVTEIFSDRLHAGDKVITGTTTHLQSSEAFQRRGMRPPFPM